MNDWLEMTPSTQFQSDSSVFTAPEPETARAILGGAHVDLRWFDEAVVEIMAATQHPRNKPLGVVSANLDHVMHFGAGSRWGGMLDNATDIEWLTLLDGAPLRAKATQLTGQQWPRLAGSDLIDPLLDEAEKVGLRVGFLGGSESTQQLLKEQFARVRPNLRVSGWWAPERLALVDPVLSEELARDVAQSNTDILVVGLGKPRQELWIAQYGALTGAPVLLAFGAVVDFLAGRIQRAPQPLVDAGMEWAWRLALEPKRLAKRYLVQGPEAFIRMSRYSSVGASDVVLGSSRNPVTSRASELAAAMDAALDQVNKPVPGDGKFMPANMLADVTVVLVTYNNVEDIDPLLAGLREETAGQQLKVVVADNGSVDGTVERIAAHPDVVLVETGANLGYAGGINAAIDAAGPCHDVLVLNPDLRIAPGAIKALRHRLEVSSAGIVVPKLLDTDGTTYHSLRREPSLPKAMGDAVFGSKLPGRPDWLSEIDYNSESYQYPHPVEWATGAALLISGDVLADVGPWDEQYFLYSEETDYFRRTRQSGYPIWFEPGATMVHSRGGSGASADLVALMAVNRVRYAAAHHSKGYAALARTIGATAELARSYKPGNRKAFLALAGAHPWAKLPKATRARQPYATTAARPATFPSGAIIIPAHNEAGVLARTLRPLAALAASGAVEVIVACNGCDDGTAAIAASFPGVTVLDLTEPSKTAALNAADAVCTRWPRLYLDADIEITPEAVSHVFEYLTAPGALAARPAFRYETTGADPLVQAYYRARLRIPKLNQHLWGAGAYAVSAAGHARFPLFPTATADDAFVDSVFNATEKAVLPTEPVVVRVPQNTRELHNTLRRVYHGKHQLQVGTKNPTGLGPVVGSIHGPRQLVDASVYATFAVSGKVRKRKSLNTAGGWDRDESSRK